MREKLIQQLKECSISELHGTINTLNIEQLERLLRYRESLNLDKTEDLKFSKIETLKNQMNVGITLVVTMLET